ncbi:ABC transporter ATP-binding protein [Candidatus Uhrbacteria bacterium]|nr:ABC transporter ATP-binding protein [Candidatus Uhrbacteria bacterium]
MSQKKTSVLRQYFLHLKPFRGTVFLLILSIASAEAVGVITPWLYKRLLDGLAVAQQTADKTPFLPNLGTMLILAIGVHALGWFLWRASGFLTTCIQPRVIEGLHETAFRNILGHSAHFFTDTFTGSLVRQVRDFSGGFGVIFESFLWRLLPLVVSLSGILIVLSRRAPTLSLLLLAWFGCFLLLNIFFFRWKRKYDLERARKDSAVVAHLSDVLTNSLNTKLFNSTDDETKRHALTLMERRTIRTFQWRLSELNNLFQNTLGIVIEATLMWMAFLYWQKGILSLGDVILCQVYLFMLLQKTWELGNTIKNVYESIADAQEMVDILNTPHEIQDVKSAKSLLVKKGAIEFEQVSFTYHQTRSILQDFMLSIKSKEKIALVGPSGAGKSTIIKLLLRFYDLDDGKILIDGQTISKVTQNSLHDALALVPQDPLLFHRTLIENIRYGRRDATDEEVIEAAKKAYCHEFILNTPHGYDTLVGERGIKLSGGERQRVAIARAILKDAPILILDEATSSLDSESESLIQSALWELMKDKTVIAIAHRLSTIMQMDRIVVMEEGRVVSTGTHDQLLHQDGIYKKLWEIQAGGFLP